jgi:4-hydroxybenzoate polyprenyltransferase
MEIEPRPVAAGDVRVDAPRGRGERLHALLAVLRPHQWAKNVLVFVPILAAHRIDDAATLGAALRTFLAFGLAASAVYVLNDVADVQSDRRHARKRSRPFASGALPLAAGYFLFPGLLVAAGILAASLPWSFLGVLGAYVGANLVYSFALKRWPIADVLLLAGLYTARVFAGGFGAGIPVSEWLASFSMFLFLSLAFLKRASELVECGEALGRGYVPGDRDVVFAMGTSAGYVSALVLALYVSSEDVRRLYQEPRWLWALCPLVLYWVSVMWIRARRGEVKDDPVLFALFDRTTWVVAALGAVVVWAAS